MSRWGDLDNLFLVLVLDISNDSDPMSRSDYQVASSDDPESTRIDDPLVEYVVHY